MARHSKVRQDKNTLEMKGLSWWTCTLCKTRWSRHTYAEAAQTTVPQDEDPMVYGRYIGSTYRQIYEGYPEYATWVLQTAQQKPQTTHPTLLQLAKYLTHKMESAQQSIPTTFPAGEMYIATGETSDELMEGEEYPEDWNQPELSEI